MSDSPISPEEILTLLAAGYTSAKVAFPAESRRKWKLRAVRHVWELGSMELARARAEELRMAHSSQQVPWTEDDDPYDIPRSSEEESLPTGTIVRTDYSDDEAWTRFKSVLEESEKEGLAEMSRNSGENLGDSSDEEGGSEGEDDEMEVDEDVQAEAGPATSPSPSNDAHTLFKFFDDPTQQRLANASNLLVLQTLLDVSIIPTPKPPPPPPSRDIYMQVPKKTKSGATKKDDSEPGWMRDNPLVDKWGMREVYGGDGGKGGKVVGVWVYDAQSNIDGSARMVSGGGRYGSFTGDSWRAKGTHVWELQYNLITGNVSFIDFGGQQLDRYTWAERKRNFVEVGVVVE